MKTKERLHHDTCVRVARLLKKGVKKGIPALPLQAVELSDVTTGTSEAPDIIAYRHNISDALCIVFEIKLSRADFLRDAKKVCRKKGCGMGAQRYYVTSEELISPDEVPEGWGLLYLREKELIMAKRSKIFPESERCTYGETNTLLNLMRRGAKWGSLFDNDDHRGTHTNGQK